MVPEKLNRGRHTVDPKKLASWRSRLKKANLDLDQLSILLQSKSYDLGNEELAKALEFIDLERFFAYIEADNEN